MGKEGLEPTRESRNHQLLGLRFCALLAEATYRMIIMGHRFTYQERAQTPGDPMRPVMIAGDIPVYWKAANVTSILARA